MHYSISEIIVLFFTYSVVGWLWETFYCSIKDHHYAYRGFFLVHIVQFMDLLLPRF